jgi:hypothetical protein
LPCGAATLVATAQAQPARAVDTPDAALTRLLEGNARYVSGKMNERDFSANRAARAQGQAPFAAVLGCADSRVAPELAFDQPPGELFVVRVAGNFMTPDGLGSLEFAQKPPSRSPGTSASSRSAYSIPSNRDDCQQITRCRAVVWLFPRSRRRFGFIEVTCPIVPREGLPSVGVQPSRLIFVFSASSCWRMPIRETLGGPVTAFA